MDHSAHSGEVWIRKFVFSKICPKNFPTRNYPLQQSRYQVEELKYAQNVPLQRTCASENHIMSNFGQFQTSPQERTNRCIH